MFTSHLPVFPTCPSTSTNEYSKHTNIGSNMWTAINLFMHRLPGMAVLRTVCSIAPMCSCILFTQMLFTSFSRTFYFPENHWKPICYFQGCSTVFKAFLEIKVVDNKVNYIVCIHIYIYREREIYTYTHMYFDHLPKSRPAS